MAAWPWLLLHKAAQIAESRVGTKLNSFAGGSKMSILFDLTS